MVSGQISADLVEWLAADQKVGTLGSQLIRAVLIFPTLGKSTAYVGYMMYIFYHFIRRIHCFTQFFLVLIFGACSIII